jgi:hypothetical protein
LFSTWIQWLTEINGVDVLINDKKETDFEHTASIVSSLHARTMGYHTGTVKRDEINNYCPISGVRTYVQMQLSC